LGGYFQALETTLDESKNREIPLRVPGLPSQQPDAKTKLWNGIYTKQRDDENHTWLLDFGGMERFFRGSVDRNADGRLHEYIRSLRREDQWWRELADDLKKVRKQYRNGGAHTERVDYQTVVDFRKLLFEDRPEGGLLQRLAEITIATASRRGN
jgi:hypothetical protein